MQLFYSKVLDSFKPLYHSNDLKVENSGNGQQPQNQKVNNSTERVAPVNSSWKCNRIRRFHREQSVFNDSRWCQQTCRIVLLLIIVCFVSNQTEAVQSENSHTF